MAALKRIISGKMLNHLPQPPPGESKIKRAGQTNLNKLAMVLGAVPAIHKLRGGIPFVGVTVQDAAYAGVVAMVVAVFLHISLTALEMQERWSLELLEEEKRAIVDRMTLNMTQRCRFGGFLTELFPRSPTPPQLSTAFSAPLRRVSLCSAAQEGFTEETLKSMVASCMNSASPKITGHFLFVPPFLSIVLEGAVLEIAEVFSAIWRDRNHHTISVISDQPISSRLFTDQGIKSTTIHPYQGFKGSIVVSIFQHLGHRFVTRVLYTSKKRDIPYGTEKTTSVVVFLLSRQPENLSLVSDVLLDTIEKQGGELFFCGLDRLVVSFELPEYDVITFATQFVTKAKAYMSDARFGAARGVVRRASISTRLYVGPCIERAGDLALMARDNCYQCAVDATLHYLRPNVELVDDAFCFPEQTVEDSPSLPFITNDLDELPPDVLVRATVLSAPRQCDIAAYTHNLIRGTVGKAITDKMILVKSHTCKLVLLLLEGFHADLLELCEVLRKDKNHKYCFLAGVREINERIFSAEFEPLQVVSGDNWCPMLKQQIKLMTKTDDFVPNVLKRLASANQFPASVGMIPLPEQTFATLIPVASDLKTLAECYRILASNCRYLWLDIIESTQRIVFACKLVHAQKLIHLCVGYSKVIKTLPSAWLAVGIATGDGLSGHIGKAHPIFFVCGPAFERAWEMAVSVITRPNAFGSSMLICKKTSRIVRQAWPDDPVVGIGSNGLHDLARWGVCAIDHPCTDKPSRSLGATYYLCNRPLQRQRPAVMQDDYVEYQNTSV